MITALSSTRFSFLKDLRQTEQTSKRGECTAWDDDCKTKHHSEAEQSQFIFPFIFSYHIYWESSHCNNFKTFLLIFKKGKNHPRQDESQRAVYLILTSMQVTQFL